MNLTVKEYAFFPSPELPQYGLLFCIDEDGGRWTLRGDPALVRMATMLSPELRSSLTIGGTWVKRPGWPDDWGQP